MKYIITLETFKESKKFKYKIGDYVLLNINKIIQTNDKLGYNKVPFKFVQIKDIEEDTEYIYSVDYDSKDKDDNDNCFIKENEIIRKLTSKEISEYEVIKNMKKYNL